MPIARGPTGGAGGISDALKVLIPFAEAGAALQEGQALAMIDVAGTKTLVLCGAQEVDHALQFIGFASTDFALGENHPIITGRGSRVQPLLQGGGPLTPDELLYLSLQPGYLTHTAPQVGGIAQTPVGHAVSDTEMILKTDARVIMP